MSLLTEKETDTRQWRPDASPRVQPHRSSLVKVFIVLRLSCTLVSVALLFIAYTFQKLQCIYVYELNSIEAAVLVTLLASVSRRPDCRSGPFTSYHTRPLNSRTRTEVSRASTY
jgi:hypothetical protein